MTRDASLESLEVYSLNWIDEGLCRSRVLSPCWLLMKPTRILSFRPSRWISLASRSLSILPLTSNSSSLRVSSSWRIPSVPSLLVCFTFRVLQSRQLHFLAPLEGSQSWRVLLAFEHHLLARAFWFLLHRQSGVWSQFGHDSFLEQRQHLHSSSSWLLCSYCEWMRRTVHIL